MKIIGLTGSIAMGKSEVAKIIKSQGVPVFDSDAEVHKLYNSQQGAALIRPIVPQAVTHDHVDRGILKNHVLANPALLKAVEKNVHTEIKNRRHAFVARNKKSGTPLIVIDTPLLFETGSDGEVDATIVVSASHWLQRERALSRPGLTADQFNKILAKQMPDVEKRAKADYILENDGTLAELETKTLALLGHLKKLNHA